MEWLLGFSRPASAAQRDAKQHLAIKRTLGVRAELLGRRLVHARHLGCRLGILARLKQVADNASSRAQCPQIIRA